MLQNLRAGNITVLIDMSHHKHRDPLAFAQLHQTHRTILHLGNRTGRRLVFIGEHGLNGVNNENIRLAILCRRNHIAHSVFRQNEEIFRGHAQSLCPHLQLTLAFLTGNIQDTTLSAQGIADLKQQRGFTDTWRTAYQHQAALYSATAQHAIQFTHTGRKTDLVATVDLRDGFRPISGTNGRRFRPTRDDGALNMLLQSIPSTAGRASSLPLGRLIAAGCAVKYGFCPSHTDLPL